MQRYTPDVCRPQAESHGHKGTSGDGWPSVCVNTFTFHMTQQIKGYSLVTNNQHPKTGLCVSENAPPTKTPRPKTTHTKLSLCHSSVTYNFYVTQYSRHHSYFTLMPMFFQVMRHGNNTTKQINQNQVGSLHLIFHCLTVVQVLFCNLEKGVTLKIHLLCFVIVNTVLFNLIHIWRFA